MERPIAPAGALRRSILIATRTHEGGGEARAAVEDDFHHFLVAVRHDGAQVTAVTAQSPRFPYSTCPAAGGELDRLVGMPLSSVANSVVRQTDPSLQCTHMLDLAGLAIAAAARGTPWRRYDCTVPDRVDDVTNASVARDGAVVLAWTVRGDTILEPEPYAGHGLRAGFAGWALANLPEADAEAALVLRRATTISIGRVNDPGSWLHARPTGFCYSQQPTRAPEALTQANTIRDWPSHEPLCAADAAFLAFAPGS
jgi:hypothetical protein